MKQKIIEVLKKSAIRTQFLGDNRLHSLIVDDDFEKLSDVLNGLLKEKDLEISELKIHLQSYRA